ncbi:MAG: hypothetical protein GXN92_02385 [Candidatus Micrarchaeota archaeon]|nr:hypothetical protein [Candidatus Micrarchaeota archaeon]
MVEEKMMFRIYRERLAEVGDKLRKPIYRIVGLGFFPNTCPKLNKGVIKLMVAFG